MNLQISIQEETDYLKAEVTGERSRSDQFEHSMGIWDEIIERARQTGHHRILIIGKVPGRASASVGSQLATNAREHGLSLDYKVAIALLNAESYISHRITETIAVSLGHWIKFFDNEKEAREWLLED